MRANFIIQEVGKCRDKTCECTGAECANITVR